MVNVEERSVHYGPRSTTVISRCSVVGFHKFETHGALFIQFFLLFFEGRSKRATKNYDHVSCRSISGSGHLSLGPCPIVYQKKEFKIEIGIFIYLNIKFIHSYEKC